MQKTSICNIHHIELGQKKVSVFLRYPVPALVDLDNIFPNHGLLGSLGGCGIEMDKNGEIANNNEEDVKVCKEYNEADGKYLGAHL